MSDKEPDNAQANPMLYDPLTSVRTSKLMQYVATIIICFTAASAGTGLAWTSPVLDQLVNENATLPLTTSEGTWVGSCLAIGALVGAIPTGILAERIGRKYTTILIGIPYIISWILTVTANGAHMLYAARFIIGISTGGSCVIAPMFISELAETSIRGALGACFQLFLTVGILLTYVVGSFADWVQLSYVCGILPICLVVGMIFVPDSPVWLLKQGRTQDATMAIKWFWGKHCDSRSAIQTLQSGLDSSRGEGSIADLFRNPANRRGFFICAMLMFFQQFSGINAVIFYTQNIFKSAGSTMEPSTCSIVVGVVQVLMTFAAAALIESAGRKILLLQSSIVMGLCLTVLGVYFCLKENGTDVSNIGWLPLICVVLFIVSFSLGYGPIPWMMMGELLADEVKGIATSFVVILNWVMVFIITKSFNELIENFGSDVTFWMFAVIMGLGSVYGYFMVFETKGKSTTEIQMILSGEKAG